MKKDGKVYLIHIRDCINRIKEYTADGKDVFFNQRIIQDAVLRNFEVMCESINKLPQEWKSSQSDILWRKVVDYRNFLAHDYLAIDLEIVWDIVENHLSPLEKAIENIAEKFWNS